MTKYSEELLQELKSSAEFHIEMGDSVVYEDPKKILALITEIERLQKENNILSWTVSPDRQGGSYGWQ